MPEVTACTMLPGETVLPADLLFHGNTIYCHLLRDTSLLTSQQQISKMPNLKQQYFKTCAKYRLIITGPFSVLELGIQVTASKIQGRFSLS